MKIAVTYENGQVFQHFGHTAQFKLYDVENGTVASSQVVDTNGSGHGALAGFLKDRQVDALICGGIGGGAQMALAEAGIRLYAGCQGDADTRVAELLAGTLVSADAATCDHHHDGEECDDPECECHHHHHHHADEVFTSWGKETPKVFAQADIERILTALDSGDYGKILRAKGIVNGEGGKWIEFDFVPEEHEVRAGHPDYTGRLCVIGAELQEDKLSQLFGL